MARSSTVMVAFIFGAAVGAGGMFIHISKQKTSDEEIRSVVAEAQKLAEKGEFDKVIQLTAPLLGAKNADIDRLNKKASESEKKAKETKIYELVKTIPVSNLKKNRELYFELTKLDPLNEMYREKYEHYNQAIIKLEKKDAEERRRKDEEEKKIRLQEQEAKKQKILTEIKLYLRTNYDDLENITWYYGKSSPRYRSDRTALFLYFGQGKTGKPWLRYVVQYASSDWLFIHSYTVYVDGRKFELTFRGAKTDNDSSIWEWIDVSPTAAEIRVLKEIINANKAVIRFQGTQYRRDHTITGEEKDALQRVLDAYKALGGSLPKS